MAQVEGLPKTKPPAAELSSRLRIAATVLRVLFIGILVALVLRVSMPQSETIWTSYETPGDFIRLALGIVVAAWLIIELFRGPVDSSGYRTWLYLGFAAVPFALICLFAVW